MTDFRYRCVRCDKEFTLHATECDFDPIEFDPTCAWCGDTDGMPCLVPKEDMAGEVARMAKFQRGLMLAVKESQEHYGEEIHESDCLRGPSCDANPCKVVKGAI